MRVVVCTEARFLRGRDGAIRAVSDGRAYAFWRRYLAAFDDVTVVARVAESSHINGLAVEGPRVRVHPIPDFGGILGILSHGRTVNRAVKGACLDVTDTIYIARVPGTLGVLMTRAVARTGTTYGLEVVGDPYTAMRSIGSHAISAWMLSHVGRQQLQKQCIGAAGIGYVTRSTLQARYPARPDCVTAAYSSVDLPEHAYMERESTELGATPRLVAVGTLAQVYKGYDVLIRAVAALSASHRPVNLRVIGDGRHRPELEALAERLGVSDRVVLVGQLSGAGEVRAELDAADVFVMPSRSEGLPRALLEAMARSLPCVATDVGGVAELLPRGSLVPPGDAPALASRICELLDDAPMRACQSKEGFHVARQYRADVTTEQRNNFYHRLVAMSSCSQGSVAKIRTGTLQ